MNENLLTADTKITPKEFPLRSLRSFLVPESVLLVKTFEAVSLEKLDENVNNWVRATSAIIAVPSAVLQTNINGKVFYSLSVTYVAANE